MSVLLQGGKIFVACSHSLLWSQCICIIPVKWSMLYTFFFFVFLFCCFFRYIDLNITSEDTNCLCKACLRCKISGSFYMISRAFGKNIGKVLFLFCRSGSRSSSSSRSGSRSRSHSRWMRWHALSPNESVCAGLKAPEQSLVYNLREKVKLSQHPRCRF